VSPAERRQLRRWLRGQESSAPQWHFILEAAGFDPLRAMEIEGRVSQEWWERWFVDREERLRAAPRRGTRPRERHSAREGGDLSRSRYALTADGRLVSSSE
jgi:hypothetical protein